MKQLQQAMLVACLLLTGVWSKHPHAPNFLERRDSSTAEAAAAPGVCTSPKCLEYAKLIQNSLAPDHAAIDPCTNFEKLACDGWRAKHNFRPDQTAVSVLSVILDTIEDLLHSILEGPYAENTSFTGIEKTIDKKNFQKMKIVYDTCMKEDAMKLYGINPLRRIVEEFNTVYPVVEPAVRISPPNQELTQAVSWLSKRAVSGLISASPTNDDKYPDIMMIGMGSSQIMLPKPYYNKSAVLTNYTRAIAETLHVLSSGKLIDEDPIPVNKNTSLFEKAQRIVNFETLIAQNILDPEFMGDIKYSYNLKSLAEIETLVPEISVIQYLKSKVPLGYDIHANRTVIVGDLNYYKNLSSIIKSTPRNTLHDYFEWTLLRTWISSLNPDYNTPLRRFGNLLDGQEPDVRPARWRTCVRKIDGELGKTLGGMFIERTFTKKDKQLGDQIITDIRSEFAENFKNLDWMSDQAKEIATKKVVNIIQKVGFQTKNPNIQKPQELDEYYAKLVITDNYFDYDINVMKFYQNLTWHTLLKPTDRDDWSDTASTVNAHYVASYNEIVFPAGIMQMPIFNGDLPEYASYGAFGAIAGHELTHGFDNLGSSYDDTGTYREWWDNSTVVRFKNQTSCYVKQYEQYSVEGLEGEKVPVNGQLTLSENIADSGGLNAAFRAWKKRETVAPNPTLPGLEKWTNEQLFFMSFANVWCEKNRKEALLQQVLTDAHSPSDKRILGTLNNSPDFKKAYNCPVTKPVCTLW